MEREIKFKGKDKRNGKWVIGDKVSSPTNVYILPNGFEISMDLEAIEVDPDTICQFPGLFDREGNEVFENDLLYSDSWEPQYYVMEWNSVYACYEINPHQVPVTFTDCFNIAGSKFDHPEL